MRRQGEPSRGQGCWWQAAIYGLLALVLALQWLLVSTTGAFAMSRAGRANDPSQEVARAGTAVVRLLATYEIASETSAQPEHSASSLPLGSLGVRNQLFYTCTGLGTIIASWSAAELSQRFPDASFANQNTWVLTDSSVVSKSGSGCQAAGGGRLVTLKVYFSNLYNSDAQPVVAYESDAQNSVALNTFCLDESESCVQDSPVVFSFNSNKLYPYVDMAQTNAIQPASLGLTTSSPTSQALPPVNAKESQAAQYLSPALLPANAALEPGTPLLDKSGALVQLRLKNQVIERTELVAALQKVPPTGTTHVLDINRSLENDVHMNWAQGIANYYRQPPDYRRAEDFFHKALLANTDFTGAHLFEQKASEALNVNKQSTSSTQATSVSITVAGIPVPILPLVIAVLAVLIILLILTSVSFGRKRVQRKRQRRLLEEAERNASVEASRISEEEEKLRQQLPAWEHKTMPIARDEDAGATYSPVPVAAEVSPAAAGNIVTPTDQPTVVNNTAPSMQAVQLVCPNCKSPVSKGDNFCHHCRCPLSPSASGLNLRIPSQYLRDQQKNAAPVAGAVPFPSIADLPTVEFTPEPEEAKAPVSKVSAAGDSERTEPGHKPSQPIHYLVGTHTDPGIKRKHKPNEDSFFAARGVCRVYGEVLPFGLFVVADGMGGHAAGRDASRLAIQTIVNFMVPNLRPENDLPREGLVRLLVDGVQQANQAVHQHNMELHADMGTTMTAAFIVADTAYVTNVGDSRTYLYRQGEQLRKVTNDHSVVASLVEAGIIQPDDIYTHPKRNQIYRSLGEKTAIEIDAFEEQVHDGDLLLLCSDGLWDMVRDPQIEHMIKQSQKDVQDIADALVQAALREGGDDNVSVIVVGIREAQEESRGRGFQVLAKPDTVQLPQLT
ncbi:PP2C family serine/threonine-protein phosphatase [Ktedonobacter racemifer]|nr:protein phosphatase 2C domain-containing protein [Ktedonobacter racemifer]